MPSQTQRTPQTDAPSTDLASPREREPALQGSQDAADQGLGNAAMLESLPDTAGDASGGSPGSQDAGEFADLPFLSAAARGEGTGAVEAGGVSAGAAGPQASRTLRRRVTKTVEKYRWLRNKARRKGKRWLQSMLRLRAYKNWRDEFHQLSAAAAAENPALVAWVVAQTRPLDEWLTSVDKKGEDAQSLKLDLERLKELEGKLHVNSVRQALEHQRDPFSGKRQQHYAGFRLDWRYAWADMWNRTENKENRKVKRGYYSVKRLMVKYEKQILDRRRDKSWLHDTRTESVIERLREYGFQIKRDAHKGTLAVHDRNGTLHYPNLTNDEMLKAAPRLESWAKRHGMKRKRTVYKCNMNEENIEFAYKRMLSHPKSTVRWRKDLKRARSIALQIVKTFDSKTGHWKWRNGWERKVFEQLAIEPTTQFVDVFNHVTDMRWKADAKVVFIGVQPFAKRSSSSPNSRNPHRKPGIGKAERGRLLRALD